MENDGQRFHACSSKALISTERRVSTDPLSLSSPVQFRDAQEHLCREVFVHDPKHDGRRGGEKQVEKDHQPVVNHGSSGEATEELVPEQEVHIGLEEEADSTEQVPSAMWEAAADLGLTTFL